MAEESSGSWEPELLGASSKSESRPVTLGHPIIDDYLRFVQARARHNTLLAVAYDLKVFFSFLRKEPADVTPADVFSFIAYQREPRYGNVTRFVDREQGLSARTIKRRLSSVSGLFGYLAARGDVGVTNNPVPRGLAARRPHSGRSRGTIPLIRTPRTVPRVLSPHEVNALLRALRTRRDEAMVLAMVLGGLRRSEVIGLRMEDINAGERRLFIVEGKGGHQRRICVSDRFMASLAAYLAEERGTCDHERVFVVLKGRRRGGPLSIAGLEQIVGSAKERAGLRHVTCHQLRHTCMTRLREAGMSLEALQSQAGHRSLEATRIYLHLGDVWFSQQYHAAVASLEGDLAQ
jgi:site-specific recombinase XerD